MKVLYFTAECKPFSKTGGVGDVAGELPIALMEEGIDIEIVTPWYGSIKVEDYKIKFHGKDETFGIVPKDLGGVPINFIKNSQYFEGNYSTPYVNSKDIPFYDDILRFSFFSEACLYLVEKKAPDIIHINDWVLGYLFGRIAMKKLPPKKVITVHNIGYQGNIGKDTIKGWNIEEILKDEEIGRFFVDPRTAWNSINALRLGLELADRANTVSPNYKNEITQPEDQERYFEGGKGLHEICKKLSDQGKLIGILNGFNYQFEPTDKNFEKTLDKKAKLKARLSKDFNDPDAMLVGFVGRAVEQKFKLLTEFIDGKSVLQHILEIPRVNVAILATGLHEYESFLKKFIGQKNYSVTIAFDKEKAEQISLGSDVFLMPSLFEPCGITQMESLCNATPPLVRWTGGLVDTVIPHDSPNGTGFGFDGYAKKEVLYNLINCVKDALKMYTQDKNAFKQLQRRGFNTRFLWSTSANKYIKELYEPVLKTK